MDLSRSREWAEDDLKELIRNQIQESVNLDYKRCPSLQKTQAKKDEVSKDVSALANSAGGVLVYGVEENGHVPTGLDSGYDPTDITKEWLEQVIQGNIRPRINGIHVNQVALTISHPNKVAYVVTIPQGGTAHQAADFRYYKRFNFESVPMHDHEVKDVMNRLRFPLITPVFSKTLLRGAWDYRLNITLTNTGSMCARDVKFIFYWPECWKFQQEDGFVQRIIPSSLTIPNTEAKTVELSESNFDKVIFPEDEHRLTERYRHGFTYSENPGLMGIGGSPKALLAWKVYADDMPPQHGSLAIADIPLLPPS